MDRCKCWRKTQVVITIEHCPSEFGELVLELDKVTRFAMEHTNIERFGKVRISAIETTDSPAAGE